MKKNNVRFPGYEATQDSVYTADTEGRYLFMYGH